MQKNNQQSTISNRLLQQRKAFTLLEMLVVIGIIAVLLGMGALSYSTAQRKARDAKRKLDISAVKNAMEQYYSLCNGAYPTAVSGKVPAAIETEAPPTCSMDPPIIIMPNSPTDPLAAVLYDYDDATSPPSICATDGAANLLESETTVYCVYLEQ